MLTLGLLFVVCGGVNFLFAFEGPHRRVVSVPQRVCYSCYRPQCELITRFSLLKQVCECFTFSLNWPVLGFYWLDITVQTALPITWKLWVSGAKLGGQHLAAHFRLGTPQAETGRKREGWLPRWFQLAELQTQLHTHWYTFSGLLRCCWKMD